MRENRDRDHHHRPKVRPDAVLAAAVDVARAAAVEVAAPAEHVGEHLGADLEGERLVTHRFACPTRPTAAGTGRSR